MPIRWDNIASTAGLWNASNQASRDSGAGVNQGFKALQGVLDDQQQAYDANYDNTTNNNSIEVQQYLQQLGNQGVEAVEADFYEHDYIKMIYIQK